MRASIENYPHVVYMLKNKWGSAAGRNYLVELLFIEPGAQRKGFSFEAFTELEFLLELHDIVFPEFAKNKNDAFWENLSFV